MDPISDLIGNRLGIQCEMFRRGRFDFITRTPRGHHARQDEALHILTDNQHTEVLYGGAAGGAKSWTGCSWLLLMCLLYPGTRWFIGREELKRLRESTLITFFKVCKAYGVKQDVDFKYNGQDHYIQFANGSRIDLLDLRYLPSDPLYERYGSVEYTGGWIEEGGEVNFGAYDTLKTRIGRHLNDKYGLLRKLLITCNPKKNWMYSIFYKPFVTGALPPHQAYLPALVQDNPFIERDYIDALRSTTDKVKRERLLKGNWDYDDNPNALCTYDNIREIFRPKPENRTGVMFITADIARYGSDKARICVWDGWEIVEHVSFDKCSTTQLSTCILSLMRKWNIPCHQVIADDDGVGGGVVDECGIKGFVNGSSPENGENYSSLQAQCAYKLAERINRFSVSFDCELSESQKDEITQELEQLQTWNVDNDRKLFIKPKEEIKQDIGRSPDWRDVLLMRSWFDVKKPVRVSVSVFNKEDLGDIF